MFKSFQLKWLFVLTVTLLVSSMLLRQGDLNTIKGKEIFDYAFRLTLLLVLGWLVNGYFIIKKFPIFTNSIRHFIGIFLATILNVLLNYIYYTALPSTRFDNGLGYHTLFDIVSQISAAFIISIICYLVFYSIHTNSALQNSRYENELLEQAHLRAQLFSLQQQISPHFLFNSLSTLKTIASDQPAKNYIVQMAAVYRYILSFNDRYLTTLQEELKFIRSYLYIMNERFEKALQVSISIPDEHLIYLLPPLTLQLLIENAIKHNVISPEKPLNLTIFTNDALELLVINNIQPKNVPEDGTGTGLKNIQERYKLLVHKNVIIQNDLRNFIVTLPLLKK